MRPSLRTTRPLRFKFGLLARFRFSSTSPTVRFDTPSCRSLVHTVSNGKSNTMASNQYLDTKLGLLRLGQVPFANCYPESNPLDVFKTHIANAVAEIVPVDAAKVYGLLQRTKALEHGDLTLPVPALGIKGEKPPAVAAKLVEKFPKSPLVDKLVIDNIHVSFFFNPSALVNAVIPAVLENPETWGSNPKLGLKNPNNPSEGRKRIVIEFSSPNVAKPFHQGHLRSTIIGGFLGNLFQTAGWDVVRLNYLGDWGKQYGLLALGFEMFGDEKELEADPINHLFQVYVKINQKLAAEKDAIKDLEAAGKDATDLKQSGLDEKARQYFKAMCDQDPKAIAMWTRFRNLSIKRYKEVYARLNIHFDEYSGESQVTEESMKDVETELSDKGLASESDGATIVDFTKHVPGKPGKTLGVALIRKQDGTSLYLTRDIGAIFARQRKYQFDSMIYVVASDQDRHLKQLFKIVELTGHKELESKLTHVNFGLVLGMSTRRGTVVFLDDVLREVRDHMHEVMRKNDEKYAQVSDPEGTADILGISSVMVQDMAGKRINNYHFNIDAMTSFEGDTGPYLQYSHARLCSILKKSASSKSEIDSADLSHLTEPLAINVVRLLLQYPDTVAQTLKTYEPTTILQYLFRLTHALNSSYDVVRVIGSAPEVRKARLALFDSTRAVLNHGMRILGLVPLERM